MTNEVKKLIISVTVLVAVVALLVTVMLVNVNLKIINFGSIKEIMNKHNEVVEAESKLSKKETEYKAAVSKVNTSKTAFDTAKAKYDAISDETINVIKEATTEENYNIEYMWIRLGNYALKNNLTIIMAEPGGSFETTSTTEKDGTTKNIKTTTTTTTTTTKNDETNTTTSNTNDTTKTDTNATTDTKQTNNTNNTNKETTDQNTLFKIQVSGSYLDVSDFVFEVENDKALRFKLDNISMDYVSGTTIKTTFNVKNLVINK